jgi:hypothetical protein
MNGYLVVLPTQNATTTSSSVSGTMPPYLLLLVGVAILAIGIVIGVVVVAKFDQEKTKN